ncbi:MAG: 50S ribosomal protein L35 [bacterium]
MPKHKTKKAAAKRFWKTGTGKVRFSRAGGGHLLTGKSRKRRRNMNKKPVASPADSKRIGILL